MEDAGRGWNQGGAPFLPQIVAVGFLDCFSDNGNWVSHLTEEAK
jgi:hypothetical protein